MDLGSSARIRCSATTARGVPCRELNKAPAHLPFPSVLIPALNNQEEVIDAFDSMETETRSGGRNFDCRPCHCSGCYTSAHRDREAHHGQPILQNGSRRAPEGP